MKASDCVNGTWLEDLGVTDYNTITKKYLQHRSTTMVPVLFDCHYFHKMFEEQEIQDKMSKERKMQILESCFPGLTKTTGFGRTERRGAT